MALSMEEFDSLLMSGEPDLAFTIDVPPEMREGMTSGGNVAARISRREALQVPAVLRSRNLIAGTLAHLPMHIRDKERTDRHPDDLGRPDRPGYPQRRHVRRDLRGSAVRGRLLVAGHRARLARLPDLRRAHRRPTACSSGHGRCRWTSRARWSDRMRVYIDGVPGPRRRGDPVRLARTRRCWCTRRGRSGRASRWTSPPRTTPSTPVPLGYFTPAGGDAPEGGHRRDRGHARQVGGGPQTQVVGYVGSAWDLKQIQFNAEQIQLAEQRQHAVLEIARACGIDPEDLGVSTTSRTYQNSEQRRPGPPRLHACAVHGAVEQRLSMRDILPRGYETKVNFDGFLRADTKTRMDTYKVGKEVGAYTHEEIRDLEDRPPLTPAQKAAAQPPPAVQPGSVTNGVPMPKKEMTP